MRATRIDGREWGRGGDRRSDGEGVFTARLEYSPNTYQHRSGVAWRSQREFTDLMDTMSASISCFWLVQYSVSFVNSPDPILPIDASASFTKGPTEWREGVLSVSRTVGCGIDR